MLDVPSYVHRLVTARSRHRLAVDVRELVRVGEFSRALARADSAELAAATQTTIDALAALHPPDDHALSSHAPPPPPLSTLEPDPAAVREHQLDRTVFHDIFFRQLPRASAADHAGWR